MARCPTRSRLALLLAGIAVATLSSCASRSPFVPRPSESPLRASLVLSGPQEYDDAEGYDDGPSDAVRRARERRATPIDAGRVTTSAVAWAFLRPEFELLEDHDEWDSAQRYEFQLLYHQERDLQVEPVTGTYFYYDRRKWSESGAKASHESIGAGIEFGAFLYPLTYEPRETLDLAFYPYGRFGIGSNGGNFRNVPTAMGTASGDLGEFRVEGAIGADVRLVVGRRMTIGLGGGVMWWDTFDTAVVSIRNGSGVVVVNNDDTDFDGRDTFLKFAVEIAF